MISGKRKPDEAQHEKNMKEVTASIAELQAKIVSFSILSFVAPCDQLRCQLLDFLFFFLFPSFTSGIPEIPN